MSKMHGNKIIAVLGPTASGKSDIAVALAKKFHGEVISADSRQVYRGMDLGTGKVTKREMKGIPHHLLDVASPKRVFTAEEYKRKAKKAIADIWKRGKLPILCGGTGFYIDTVIYGAEFPKVPPNVPLRKKMEKKATEILFKELERIDPERAASIDSKNRHRIIRSLEIAKAIGKVPKIKLNPLPADVLFIGIKKEPAELKKLISTRLKKRIQRGMLREIGNLHKSGVSWKRLESFGLEYKWGAKFLKKEITAMEFFDGLERDINRYAKRQMTWFKRNKDIRWVKTEKETLKLAEGL